MEINGENGANIIGSTGSINLCPTQQEETSVLDLTNQVHHLPCCVKFTGPSHVSHYFKPKSTGVEVDGLELEEGYFRGRKLQGVSVPVPDGYSGFILGKKKASKDKAKKATGGGKSSEISSACENSWEMLAKTGNMTFWNHDSLPSQDDACLRLFHWFAVAKALHEPSSTTDLKSASVNGNQKS